MTSPNNGLIRPTPEQFAEWLAIAKRMHPNEKLGFISGQIAELAYRAGAEMQLKKCISEGFNYQKHLSLEIAPDIISVNGLTYRLVDGER